MNANDQATLNAIEQAASLVETLRAETAKLADNLRRLEYWGSMEGRSAFLGVELNQPADANSLRQQIAECARVVGALANSTSRIKALPGAEDMQQAADLHRRIAAKMGVG